MGPIFKASYLLIGSKSPTVEIKINKEGDISLKTAGYIDVESGLFFINCDESALKNMAIKELKDAKTSKAVCGHSEMYVPVSKESTMLTGGSMAER